MSGNDTAAEDDKRSSTQPHQHPSTIAGQLAAGLAAVEHTLEGLPAAVEHTLEGLPAAMEHTIEGLAGQVAPAPLIAAAHAQDAVGASHRQADAEEASAAAARQHLAAVHAHNIGRASMELSLPQQGTWAAVLRGDAGAPEDFVTLRLDELHGKEARDARRVLVEYAMRTLDQDNEPLLRAMHQRLARVGMAPPTVEVRFSGLTVDTSINVGTRGMPSVLNFFRGKLEFLLQLAHLYKPETRPFNLLSNVSGTLKPGRLTLLLGPPSSGKSTLLKLLAGVLRPNNSLGLAIQGSTTYNGEVLNRFEVRRTASYVEQVDNHLGELTVRETLDFSARCLGVGDGTARLAELREREKAAGITPDPVIDGYMRAAAVVGGRHSVVTEAQLRLLGLDVCADTVVGGQMLRGVSGGQKKRVTAGEMLVGPHQVYFLDEVSTGLDSSTTRLITQCLRNMAHMKQSTILCALLQPPPEVYDLFDDIMLLSDGRVVFHGPREDVVPFFASLGFAPPERKCVADFLQEVTSRKDQGLYWTGATPHAFVPVNAMVQAFEESELGRKRARELSQSPELLVSVASAHRTPAQAKAVELAAAESNGSKAIKVEGSGSSGDHASGALTQSSSLEGRNGLHANGTIPDTPPPVYASDSWPPDPLSRTAFALNGWQAFQANLLRDFTLMTRLGFLWAFKTFQAVFTGIIFSTLFVKSRMGTGSIADGSLYLAIIFYSITHSMFNGYVEMSILVQGLRVFFKQRNARFFPPWTYTLPPVLLRVPFSVLDAAIWSCMVYWITGMAPSAGRFFIFFAYMFLLSQMALALFRAIGALARNYDTANSFGSTALILLLLLSGFILAKGNIHPWWIWAFWMSPITYAQQALSVNELTAPRWSTPTTYNGQVMTVGEATLQSFGLFSDPFYVWLGVLVLLGYTALFQVLAFVFLTVLNEPPPPPPVVSDAFLAARDANIKGGELPPSLHDAPHPASGPASNGAPVIVKPRASPPSATVTRKPSIELCGGVPNQITPVGPVSKTSLGMAAAPGPHSRMSVDRNSRVSIERGGSGSVAFERGSASMALPFEPMNVSFSNICYSVDMPSHDERYEGLKAKGEDKPQLRLLTNITGSFRPGVLTALMGVSGAGKTTLMDVLAGRKTTGTTTGMMKVDGFPVNQDTFARVCGYVEQADIHCPGTTVREAIYISGHLRLARTERSTLEAFVDEVMGLVELGQQAGSLVGLPGQFGLSVEQRKRLTIGVELVANPSVVFMDEPTSGLDARAAAIVMRAVRNTVNTGRTVVCTIHQPSIDIFESFDELLLLKRGGRTIYHGRMGELSKHLVAYFQASAPGVPKCPTTLNPATWMLEISSPAEEGRLGVDFADLYDKSPLCQQNEVLVEQLSVPKKGAQALTHAHAYARGYWTQFTALMHRNLLQYWRNSSYNGVRYMFCTVLGLMLGSIFWGLGSKTSTPTDVFNVMGALFICITFLGTFNASGVLPVLAAERPVFYRERAAKMYGALPYAAALGLVELPYIAVQAIVYGAITYFMIQFELTAVKFFWYLLFVFLTLTFFTYYGFCITSLMPIVELSAVISSMFYSLWFVLGGFFISEPQMPPWWQWLYWIDPLSYALYGIIGSQLCDITDSYVDKGDGSTPVSVSQFVYDSLNFKQSFVGPAAAILAGFIFAFWFVFCYALMAINHNKR